MQPSRQNSFCVAGSPKTNIGRKLSGSVCIRASTVLQVISARAGEAAEKRVSSRLRVWSPSHVTP